MTSKSIQPSHNSQLADHVQQSTVQHGGGLHPTGRTPRIRGPHWLFSERPLSQVAQTKLTGILMLELMSSSLTCQLHLLSKWRWTHRHVLAFPSNFNLVATEFVIRNFFCPNMGGKPDWIRSIDQFNLCPVTACRIWPERGNEEMSVGAMLLLLR